MSFYWVIKVNWIYWGLLGDCDRGKYWAGIGQFWRSTKEKHFNKKKKNYQDSISFEMSKSVKKISIYINDSKNSQFKFLLISKFHTHCHVLNIYCLSFLCWNICFSQDLKKTFVSWTFFIRLLLILVVLFSYSIWCTFYVLSSTSPLLYEK